ncbi:hypothetical protein B23_1896 [Geobacillus thermoleovorans B23]|nr:hypothetical protein B23_1896 [Geobacillus thermoleovorans B23]
MMEPYPLLQPGHTVFSCHLFSLKKIRCFRFPVI